MISQKPAINKLLNEGRQSRQKRTKTLATWALRTIKQLQGDAGSSKCVCFTNFVTFCDFHFIGLSKRQGLCHHDYCSKLYCF